MKQQIKKPRRKLIKSKRKTKRWAGVVAKVFELTAAGEISHSDAFIYACIARHADPVTGIAFPKETTIWGYTDFKNIRSVERAIKKLKSVGLIEIKKGWSNKYLLPFHNLKNNSSDAEI